MDLLSPVHLGIILIVALLIFGPKRLPELGHGLGKTIRDFRKAMQDNAAGTSAAGPDEGEMHE